MKVRSSLVVIALVAVACKHPSSAEVGLSEGVTRLSQQLSQSLGQQQTRLEVAILPFVDTQGRVYVLGQYLSEKIVTALGREGRFDLIERARLDRVMNELKLSSSELISDETASSIGNLIGADAIVIGTLTDLGSGIDLNCRVVAPESGKILGTGTVVIARDAVVDRLWRPADGSAAPSAGEGTRVFDSPRHNGHALDLCLHWSHKCGEPAATAWCAGATALWLAGRAPGSPEWGRRIPATAWWAAARRWQASADPSERTLAAVVERLLRPVPGERLALSDVAWFLEPERQVQPRPVARAA